MRRLLGVVLLVAGCYQPRVPIGAACSDEGACPSGQTCAGGVCQRPGALDPDAAIDVDAPIDAPIDGPSNAPTWPAGTRVPGVNSAMVEDDPSATPDRLTIVFQSNRNGNGTDDLFLGTRASTAASFVVVPLDALNTAISNEDSPEITADGNTIYFTSDRLMAGSSDVFVSRKVKGVWFPPALVLELSTQGDEGDLAISPDELTAMVSRSGKLSIATRTSTIVPFGAPVAVPSLTLPSGDLAGPSITNNAETVYFHAGSVRDLYYATRTGTTYTAPVPISQLNTPGRDDAPFISADEHYLLYAHANDLYETTR
jgi:WD40 repeat protein